MSRSHGSVFEHLRLPVPPPADRTTVYETDGAENGLIIGYAYIERTPLVLMDTSTSARSISRPWKWSKSCTLRLKPLE